jgi:hypothetical protein
MPGTIFYRARRKAGDGRDRPEWVIVAVADLKLKLHVKHLRRNELEQIAAAAGADIVELANDEGSDKMSVGGHDDE